MERQPFFFEVRLQLKLNRMKKRIYNLALISTALPIFFLACKKDSTTPTATLLKEWTVPLSVKNEIPSHAGRTETGTATIRLLSDNTITYQITVNGLTSGDGLTAAHIHAGNVITSGPVVLGFDPVFTGSTATGTIKNIRSTFIDSLKDDVNELYFNVHSTQQPGGLIRGQLNVGIEMAEDVVLLGTHEATPVTTTAIGLARLPDPGVVEVLAAVLSSTHTPDRLRSSAILALGWIGTRAAIDSLMAMLDRATLAPEILTSIGKTEREQVYASESLVAYLRLDRIHPAIVKQEIAAALGNLGNPQTVPDLIQLLADPDDRVRLYTIAAISKLLPTAPQSILELVDYLR